MSNHDRSSFELTLQPALLTGAFVAIAVGLGVFYPLPLVGLFVLTAPVALIILWQARGTQTPQERIEEVDREQAKRRTAARPAAPERRAA